MRSFVRKPPAAQPNTLVQAPLAARPVAGQSPEGPVGAPSQRDHDFSTIPPPPAAASACWPTSWRT